MNQNDRINTDEELATLFKTTGYLPSDPDPEDCLYGHFGAFALALVAADPIQDVDWLDISDEAERVLQVLHEDSELEMDEFWASFMVKMVLKAACAAMLDATTARVAIIFGLDRNGIEAVLEEPKPMSFEQFRSTVSIAALEPD